jgi:hypothetical protein
MKNIILILITIMLGASIYFNYFNWDNAGNYHALADSLRGANQLLYRQVNSAHAINNSLQDSLRMIVNEYNLQSQQVTLLEVTIESLQASLVPVNVVDTIFIDSSLYHHYALDTSKQDIFGVTGNVLAKEPPRKVNFSLFQASPLHIDKYSIYHIHWD